MSLGIAGSVLLGAGAFSATTQVVGANQQAKAIQKQAEYNAQVYGQQAEMVKEQKNIQDKQFARQLARTRSSIVSKTAGKGFLLSGSALAIIADTESEMLFDKSIMDYNNATQRNYALSGANYYRQQGAINSRLTRASGYGNAFSTVLNTGYKYIREF